MDIEVKDGKIFHHRIPEKLLEKLKTMTYE